MNKSHRLNEEINAPEIRLIGAEGEQLGVVSSRQANYLAEEAGLDLVEIAPQAAPPVCRIMDYGKFKYQEAKKAHEAKQKQKQVQVKEIKLRPGTDENDYQIKLRNMIRFLEEEDKVKVTLRFRGREMAHQEFGMRQLERIRNDLDAYGLVEQMPKMEGRQMVMIIGPAKKKLEKPEKPVEKSTDKPARLGTAKLATPAAAKPAAAKPAEVVEKSAEEAEA
ncbi:MAG: translation initiation factor IF-3 [Zoogloeaceae bacterium]|nr:translation initiation factor IF-3 [Zoogloeaceae bacterium]